MRSNITATKLLAIVLAVGLLGSSVAFAFAVPSTQTTDSHVSTQDTSYLRVVHASPDAPAVDVRVENETVLSNVSFGAVSDYLSLPAGTYNVSIVVSGTDTAVFDDAVTLSPRSMTTVAASGEVSENASSTFEPVFFVDDAYTPAENESALSVIHLSPDAPAVDVTTANGSVVLAENVTFQNGSDYVSVPAGDYTVEVRPATAGNNGSVVATFDVSLESGMAYSALAVGYLDPEAAPADTPFDLVLTEDATLTVELPSADESMNESMNETTTPEEETTTPDEETETETTTPEEETETETTAPEEETESEATATDEETESEATDEETETETEV